MPKLYVVGTPIGNLQDITFRAVATLQMVDVIACEDTRVTRNLLNAFDIKDKKLIAYHDHNEKFSAQGIIKLIQEGHNVAVVSDAGMPTINDPGFEVVREAILQQVEIELIPGVSALTMTVALSNLDTHFTFLGFLKPKSGQRQNQFKALMPGTYVAFVSPHQLLESLHDLNEALGPTTKVFLGRELTKLHESHYRGSVVEVMAKVKDHVKGEFTLAFEVKRRKVNKYD